MTPRRSRTRHGAVRLPSAPAAVVAAGVAVALATLGFGAPAAAGPVPIPPAQAVKMGQEPGALSYGQAMVVNDDAAHVAGQWYAAGAGSSNTTGFTDYVLRTGAGQYRVWLPGLGSYGAAVVTSAAGLVAGAYCVVADVVAVDDRDVPGTDIVVSCFGELGLAGNGGAPNGGAPAGVTAGAAAQIGAAGAADATFTLAYSYLGITDLQPTPRPGQPSAYLRADRPTARTYVPDVAYQYHVAGESNVVARTGTGDYLVHLPRPGVKPGGRGDVTGYGPGDHRCEIVRVVVSATELTVAVHCRNPEGAADAPFVFTYGGSDPLGHDGRTSLGSSPVA